MRQGSTLIAAYRYDGQGNRIRATQGGVITTYISNLGEWTESANGLTEEKSDYESLTVSYGMTRYYYAGGERVAVRVPNGGAGVLRFLINDQVSSTSLAVNLTSVGSAEMGEMRYYPFGTERFSSGTVSTRRQYTGQILPCGR